MPSLHTILAMLPLVALASAASVQFDPQKVLGSDNRPSSVDGEQVRQELLKAQIIPGVIPDFTPGFLLSAQWSPKTHAELGNTLKPKKLSDEPTITLTPTITTQLPAPDGSVPQLCSTLSSNTTSNMTYAIVLTDPDAPSYDNPEWSEFCHWIATGHVVVTPKLPPSDSDTEVDCPPLRLSSLRSVMPYTPPSPPKKTGKHRYVFLAFTPINATTEPLNVTKPGDRKRWGSDKMGNGVEAWAEENGLAPIAANFIFAKNKNQ